LYERPPHECQDFSPVRGSTEISATCDWPVFFFDSCLLDLHETFGHRLLAMRWRCKSRGRVHVNRPAFAKQALIGSLPPDFAT
jgi:hypothetical protein